MRACWPTTTSSAPSRAAGCYGSTGRSFLVLRPTLSDIVLKMPRGAQVIYPKDLGAILIAADIAPGQRILEAGVGSGALSMTVLRAGASIVGYELREDFAERAQANVAATLGPDAPYRIEIRDVTEGIDETRPGPDPARHARAPQGGGRRRRRPAPRGHPAGLPPDHQPDRAAAPGPRRARLTPFGLSETQEIMRRTWHVEARSVRPDHRMVGHTGFLTTAPSPGGLTVDEGRRRVHRALSPQQRPSSTACTPSSWRPPRREVALSYGMPGYRVGARRLNLGVWKHGVSVYGLRNDNDGGFLARHPELSSGKGTIRISPRRGRGDHRRGVAGAAGRGAGALRRPR